MERSIKNHILQSLEKKIIFITGPRQVGKTWLAKEIAKNFQNSTYLNWDEIENKKTILNKTWHYNTEILILDEIHKMKNWKNYLKGLYDTKNKKLKIIVTGSARLDLFRNAGDSLAGRYYRYRLNPITFSEINNPTDTDIDKLIERGGFPEPFLAENLDDINRWRQLYLNDLIHSDVLDLEKIIDLKTIKLILEILRRRVGLPISYKTIAEDIQKSPNTVKKYIELLEAIYVVFRVIPYSKNIARSLLKEPKIYFYDSGLVIGDEGQKFENFIALNLQTLMNTIEDLKGKSASLYYLKTKEKKEIDFFVTIEGEAPTAIEVKLSQHDISSALYYFKEKYNLKCIQLVKNLNGDRVIDGIELVNAFTFLKNFNRNLDL